MTIVEIYSQKVDQETKYMKQPSHIHCHFFRDRQIKDALIKEIFRTASAAIINIFNSAT